MMLIFFCIFMVEVVIILMNLIVGLAISNIQDMRHNADGHRLATEVLLQCYLESMLHVNDLKSRLPTEGRNLSEIIGRDKFRPLFPTTAKE